MEIGQRFDFDKMSNYDVEFTVSRSALEDKKPERSKRKGVKEKGWRKDESKSTSVAIGVEKLNMRVNTYTPCTRFITSAAMRRFTSIAVTCFTCSTDSIFVYV